jgi:hypothetical protein
MKTKHVLMGISLCLLLLSSCSQLVGPAQSATEQPIQKATMSIDTDLSRGQGVYVNEKGARIDIVSQEGEEGASVSCVEALKIVEVDPGSASATASHLSARPKQLLKALVLGRRHDGFPGIWLIFNDDSIHVVEDNEEGGKCSKLAETKELNWLLHGIFGWVYHAQTLLGPDSQGGFIIVGYAENPKGFDIGRWEIEPGTTVAVYWRLLPNPHGFFRLSRARIIGQPSAAYAKHWKEIDQEFHGKSYRHHLNRFLHSVFSSFRLFFLDWFDLYLTNFTSASYDKQKDVYLVTGPAEGPAVKMEGQTGTATIELDGIITIVLEPTNSNPGLYERIVIETYPWKFGVSPTDTALYLFFADGKRVPNGVNDDFGGSKRSRLDVANLMPGTYYIGIISPSGNHGPYVIRALSLKSTDAVPDLRLEDYPNVWAVEPWSLEGDDAFMAKEVFEPESTGGTPDLNIKVMELPLGSISIIPWYLPYLNRNLTTNDTYPPSAAGDVDWCVLELPKLP